MGHRRILAGREPSAAISDSQSVKTIFVGGFDRGVDGGKKVNGRKRHCRALSTLKLPSVVAFWENHRVLMPRNERVRWTRWRQVQRLLSDGGQAQRFVRQCVFGKRWSVRSSKLTSDPERGYVINVVV